MDFLKDRRFVLLAGAVVALLAGLLIALAMTAGRRGEGTSPPPASQAGLVIDTSGANDGKMNPAKPLRCFVAGQFVGELTLAQCAKRNGVATDALDVGLDQSGELAAADQAGAMITPLPPADGAAPVEPPSDPAVTSAAPAMAQSNGAPGACWRYADAQWRRLPAEMPLSGCIQTLFAGHCERPGGATYGRWAQQTLRLVPGKVEMSADNRSFHTVAEQTAACLITPMG